MTISLLSLDLRVFSWDGNPCWAVIVFMVENERLYAWITSGMEPRTIPTISRLMFNDFQVNGWVKEELLSAKG